MTPIALVTQEGLRLEQGATKTFEYCPFCKGGDHGDRGTFGVTRDSRHLLLYKCHRVKCRASGRVIVSPSHDTVEVPKAKFAPRPYKGVAQELSIDDLQKVSDLWRVDLEDVYNAGWALAPQERGWLPLLFPVISPTGVVRGHVLRIQNEDGTKTVRGFKIVDEPWQSWYVNKSDHIVVVEDQISALRAAEFCTSVALLGTEMSPDKFEEIVRFAGNRKIWFALDRDAAKEGFNLLKRYRLYFPNLSLLLIRKDIKNMSSSELLSYGGPFSGS